MSERVSSIVQNTLPLPGLQEHNADLLPPILSQAATKPEVDHNKSYTKYERIALGLAHYHAELHDYTQSIENPGSNPVKKRPVVLQIARMYDIPESTLRRHIKNPGSRSIAEANKDKQILTVEEEKALVERLLFLDDFNIPADKTLVFSLAHKLLHRRDPKRIIGKDWFYSFLARHPECRYLTVKSISTLRANAVNYDALNHFFIQLKYTIDKYKIVPKNTYNMDETGFILGTGEEVKRICRNIRKNSVYKEFTNRESCSVVECISTDGFTITPLVIFKGSNYLAGWFKDIKPDSYWYRYSPKGYNNSLLCLEYLRVIFEPETSDRSNGEWRLLIFDGFESHLQLEIIEFCLDNNIIPLYLPSHTSHVLQPLDVGVFSLLKKYYRQEVSKLRCPITKNNFPNLLSLVRQKAFTVSNIQSGFRASGIYPYNPAVILDTLTKSLEEILISTLSLNPIPVQLQAPIDLINFNPPTPITPRGINSLYMEARKSYIMSNSPSIIKLQTIITKLKNAAEKNSAQVVMHEAGEAHLREVIKQKDKDHNTTGSGFGKRGTRHLNTGAACVIERDTVLLELKKRRDEKEKEGELKKQARQERQEKIEFNKRVKQEEKERKLVERERKAEERQKALEKKEQEKQNRLKDKRTKSSRMYSEELNPVYSHIFKLFISVSYIKSGSYIDTGNISLYY